jgi:acetamidase/formamidase
MECPLERLVLTVRVRDDVSLTLPRVETPDAWLTIGLNKDLDEAAALALGGMLDFMEAKFGWSRPHAMAMASVLVDLRITQVVNGVRSVHAVLDRRARTDDMSALQSGAASVTDSRFRAYTCSQYRFRF